MSGYFGYSKSNNAILAEEEDRYPISRAASILAKKVKWTTAKARAFLLQNGTREWHHTSCKYNRTDYYDVSDEFVEENKEEIKNFDYEKESKKEPVYYFKCWNFERNIPRSWEWKVTNRRGNHCIEQKEILPIIKKMIEENEEEERKGKKIPKDNLITLRKVFRLLSAENPLKELEKMKEEQNWVRK